MNAIKVYVPRDATALALGAESVARAIAQQAQARGAPVQLVRNGSRGMFWLEPLVEVATDNGRLGYGPVCVTDVPSLFEADFLHGGAHRLALGRTEEIAYLKRQERLCFARVGVTDPLDFDDYLAHGGYRGLQRALDMKPAEIVQTVTDSGLRGRGGAAFPAGIKWKTVLEAPLSPTGPGRGGARKYIVCNADEGDSGTFSDRMLMEGDPFLLIEGMTIAALAVGADKGYVYIRSEYPHAVAALNAAIAAARRAGYLGARVGGSSHAFDIEVRVGAGAYVCGEETSLLESLEGRRGIVRAKPPLPAHKGLFGKPTVINNMLSFAAIPFI